MTTNTTLQRRVPDLLADLHPSLEGLVRAFLAGRTARTLEAYREDLESLRAYLGVASVDAVARELLGRGHGAANAMALAYRAHLVERGLAPATVNRRLAAVRSLVKVANTLGLVGWRLEVENVKSERYRDTRGPGLDGFRKMLRQVDAQSNKGRRDVALLRLLFDLALRRGEALSLDVEHVDIAFGTVSILGKGRTERVALSLPAPTSSALTDWLEARGSQPGPLFLNMDRAGKGQRLTGRSVVRILARLGAGVGLSVRPHGLRHAAITEALEVTGGDVRKVQRFSRHRDVRTVALYDDNRRDIAGEVARIVAASV